MISSIHAGFTCHVSDWFGESRGVLKPGAAGHHGITGSRAGPLFSPRETAAQPAPGTAGFLNRVDVQDKYVRLGTALAGNWDQLNPKERATKSVGLINAVLPEYMPPLKVRPDSEAEKNYAAFESDVWGVTINPSLLARDGKPNQPPMRPDDTRINDPQFVLAACYHEARHAEQRFLVARYLGATRRHASSESIRRELDIPQWVARLALRAAPGLRADPILMGFAKWLYVGGFAPDAVVEQNKNQADRESTGDAFRRAKAYIRASEDEWFGRGIAAGYTAQVRNSARGDEHFAIERWKAALRARYRAFDTYVLMIKEQDARVTSHRVAELLGVTRNRRLELDGNVHAIDGMPKP